MAGSEAEKMRSPKGQRTLFACFKVSHTVHEPCKMALPVTGDLSQKNEQTTRGITGTRRHYVLQ